MARNAAVPILTAEPGLTHYLEEIRRFPMVMNEVQFLFASEPCKPLKPRSLYVVFLVEKDVRVERRRTCNYLNHEEINEQYEVCTSSYQKHRNEEEGCIVAFVTAARTWRARTGACASRRQAPVKCTRVRSVDCFDPNRSRAPTAITSRHQSAARRITRSAPKRGASCRTTRTRSRRGHASEYAVNLGGHDEVVLMQSLDLLGLQRDRRIAPTEADIRMMAFGLCEFTNLPNKGKRLAEIAKPEAPLDAVSFLRQLPVWGLCVKELSLLAREWGYSPATGNTGFASKSFGHVACPSCQPSPAPRLANCESDVAISANQAIEG